MPIGSSAAWPAGTAPPDQLPSPTEPPRIISPLCSAPLGPEGGPWGPLRVDCESRKAMRPWQHRVGVLAAPSWLPGSRLASSLAPCPPGDLGCSSHLCPWSHRPSPWSLGSWHPGGAGTTRGSQGLQPPRGICDETAHPGERRGPVAPLKARGPLELTAVSSAAAPRSPETYSQDLWPVGGQALDSGTLLHTSRHICDV